MAKNEQSEIIEEIRLRKALHSMERWETAGESLSNVDVVEILDCGLSSEMVAAVFQCPIEDVENTAILDRDFISHMKKLTDNLERKYGNYDHSGEPYLGLYPVRK